VVSLYLDASVLVALFAQDLFTSRADAYLRAHQSLLIVSDFAAAEFASAIGRRVRIKALTIRDAHRAFSSFDGWTGRAAQRIEIEPADISTAQAFLRRLDLTLRTPDALNIAAAQRTGATLVTFDQKMAANASALGTEVARIEGDVC
jgi:predicted nucleic acid-binding protein